MTFNLQSQCMHFLRETDTDIVPFYELILINYIFSKNVV